MFPYKPPANMYPFYTGCHTIEYSTKFFCFDANDSQRTIHSFITGLWANNFFFHISDPPNLALAKCCRVPTGYYIDYMSCYYVSTHDPYFEFYDNVGAFLTTCATGYVATGIAKKIEPYTSNSAHPSSVDWMQCCRLGFGPPEVHPPPVIYAPSGAATYYTARALTADELAIPTGYKGQYRSKETPEDAAVPRAYDEEDENENDVTNNSTASGLSRFSVRAPERPRTVKTAESLLERDRELRLRQIHVNQPNVHMYSRL
ncbi:uncharacterized protein LOC129583430 [Paramacrobiotus metropolitanus]|uniref:uncharacterized protein LOC129583430 n=1 Tax=Paramacrobiotus metropolitanus TaxID=2943436 RepID=UPI0024458841|nr:uncharacterized protein LOC129583430 [Paramacrobiotus metropolitanus]